MKRVDPHAVLGGGALQRDGFCEQADAALGRAIAGHVGRGLDSRNRGDIDDAAAATCAHQRKRGFDAEEDAIEVDGNLASPVGKRHVDDRTGEADPGVVDENVEPAEPRLGF